ncbi:FxLD family lanthipeptide [Kitasatospora sp. NPDC051914]|uniref:FxLD family lanthipeptide n=1 Tax=Kitasatospora sp. NPDC051914 TaxID=3154945 RepID=UPI0034420FC7
MTHSVDGTTAAQGDFDLDVHVVVEAGEPVKGLLRSTDDGCGSSCSGSACVSYISNPS